ADPAACEAGIAPGMALTDAWALVPDLAVASADFTADAEALQRLAAWCGRWSPWTAPCPPDGVWLDVTGCAHLHGGEAGLVDEAVEQLARRGLTARAAIADTAGAAWAVACFGAGCKSVVPEGGLATALADLPVAALRLPSDRAETLARVGLRRIGDLYPMPRPSLVLRFGAGLAARLDQALGRLDEPLSPLPPPPQLWVRRRFAEPIAAPEQIRAATSELIAGLCRRLAAEGEGARRIVLRLHRVDGTAALLEIGTARPSREPRHLLRLLDERLGTLDPGLGVEDMLLAASFAEAQAPAQYRFALGGEGRGEETDDDLATLVDRLAARLGPRAVSRPLLWESHWPERAVRFVPPLDRTANARAKDERPVRFLPRPEPVDAVAPVPDDPPLLFRWRKIMHRVRRADGPERIAGEWWRQSCEPRDYYRVEDHDGRRFWLYRAGLHRPDAPARWFLHGVFG
ncbi:MAG TPA: DNA polymerase Y family protein, partial [Stellaceae bacterium]|nr:DNA polymerase Y family protein [Stellaceae bacterium]